jgi:hypothetical protein
MKIVDKSTIKSSFLAVEITGRYNPAVRVSWFRFACSVAMFTLNHASLN